MSPVKNGSGRLVSILVHLAKSIGLLMQRHQFGPLKWPAKDPSKDSKSKRVIAKPKQVEILRSYFQINQHLDAEELEMLSQKACLDKKFVQAWFRTYRSILKRSEQCRPNPKQLEIMRSHFKVNQCLDPYDLETLSQKTGLDKKFLQAWFHNKQKKMGKNYKERSIQEDSESGDEECPEDYLKVEMSDSSEPDEGEKCIVKIENETE